MPKGPGGVTKFVPMIVSVTSGLPAAALVGEIELIESDPCEIGVTLNSTESEAKRGLSPILSQICTEIWAVAGLFNKVAGTIAVS